MNSKVYKRLEGIVGKEYVSDSDEDRIAYSCDATRRRCLPDVIVKPRMPEEISKLLVLANEESIPVYPRGASTGQTGGSLALQGGIALDTMRLDGILEVSAVSAFAVAETGVIIGDLQERVGEEGLFYPPDPASSEYCTLGGTIAECSSGLRAVKYGVTRDYILGLETVLPTGEIIHTGTKTLKGVTGYDLTRLFVGSEGTLGVFTKATVRLLPLPEVVRTFVFLFDTLEEAAEAVSAITAAGIIPRTLELLDDLAIRCVESSGRFPMLKDAKALVLAELDGSALPVESDSEKLVSISREQGAHKVMEASEADERESLWEMRRQLSPGLFRISPDKVNEDICVPRGSLAEMLRRVRAIADEHSLCVVCFGHAGDGNLHVNFMIDKSDPDEVNRAEKAVREMFEQTVQLHGTLSAEHGIGVSKAKYLGIEIPEREMQLMRDVKRLFDPNNILNPGKIFPDN